MIQFPGRGPVIPQLGHLFGVFVILTGIVLTVRDPVCPAGQIGVKIIEDALGTAILAAGVLLLRHTLMRTVPRATENRSTPLREVLSETLKGGVAGALIGIGLYVLG